MTQSEETLCEWQLEMTGSFLTLLIKAMMKADLINEAKLRMGYPELSETIHRYKNEPGYYDNLCEEWNEKHPNHKIN